MQYRDAFSSCHPLINFLYFASVLLFTMFLMHPVSLVISLVSGITYAVYLNGEKAVRFCLMALLPMMLMAAVVNPVFNHEGMTILTYLPSGNPLTLESIVYGIAAAFMLASVMIWFSCYTAVMTSDKFVYLFGRVIPALSLVLSMTLRFVPRFKRQFQVVAEAQACMGRDIAEGNLLQRLKKAMLILSIMVTWSLESAIESADSMKSRGYGLPGRTAFSIYKFDERDKLLLIWLLFCCSYIGVGWLRGGMNWQYYPLMKGISLGWFSLSVQLVYLLLCLTPMILNGKEELAWKHLQSNI